MNKKQKRQMKNCMYKKVWTFLLVVCLLLPSVAQAQNLKGSFPAESLASRISRIAKDSGRNIAFDENKVKAIQVSILNVDGKSVEEVLTNSLQSTRFTFRKKADNTFAVYEKPEEPSLPAKQPIRSGKGTLSGSVVDEQGEPIPGVTVVIKGSTQGTNTDLDGRFILRDLSEGTKTVTVSFLSFETLQINDVKIEAGKTTALNVAMKTATQGLEEVVITASYGSASTSGLLARQKNSASVSDGISSEQISRTSDNNIGQVLKRISGLQTTDDNKFAVIRGLGERYNNVLLNGSQLPSSEPNRRNFSFDMISSTLVDNIVVNKTGTPDMPGEFSGGIVHVNTKDIPSEDFFQIDLGTGINSMSVGKDFIGLERGRYNHLGFLDNKVHGEPSGISFSDYNEIAYKIKQNSASEEEFQKSKSFLGTLPNTWQMRTYKTLPMQSIALSGGKNITVGPNQKLGFIGVLSYRNDQNINDYNLYQPSYKDYKGKEYKYVTTLGGNFNIGYSFNNQKISWQNTYSRRLTEKLYKYNGLDLDAERIGVMGYTYQLMTNELFQTKLQGQHGIANTGIKVEWVGDWATLKRDQPFSRLMNARGFNDPNIPSDYYSYYFSNPSSIDYGSAYYSKLKEKRYSAQLNITIPFTVFQQSHNFKAGWLSSYRKANFGSDMYRILFPIGSPALREYPGLPYYDVYNTKRFGDGELYLYPISGNGTDGANGTGSGYIGSQKMNAFYGMLDLKIIEKLRVIGGIRKEGYKQEISTRVWKPGNIWAEVPVEIEKTEWLPSINLIYAITPSINARAAWYKTVARPDLRETSGFEYYDYEILRTVVGSSNLKTTSINNGDIRLEWYPSSGEVVSISGFYKYFKNPIELRMEATSGRPWYFYENLLSAKDLGLEIDFRKSLDFINGSSPLWKNLYLSGNLTVLKAEIEFNTDISVDPSTKEQIQSKRSRPLAGQSPYVINGGISYIGKRVGLNLNYNRYGRRIIYSAVDRSNDEYEHPRDILDMQVSFKPLKNDKLQVKFNISNILNQESFTYQNRYGEDGGPTGAYPNQASIQKYPDDRYKLPDDQLDPKGAAYNEGYDTKNSSRKFGVSYSLSLSYLF